MTTKRIERTLLEVSSKKFDNNYKFVLMTCPFSMRICVSRLGWWMGGDKKYGRNAFIRAYVATV